MCAMPDLKPNGFNPRIWENNFQPEAPFWISSRAKGAPDWASTLRRKSKIVNSAGQVVLRRRHTLAVFPDKKFSSESERFQIDGTNHRSNRHDRILRDAALCRRSSMKLFELKNPPATN